MKRISRSRINHDGLAVFVVIAFFVLATFLMMAYLLARPICVGSLCETATIPSPMDEYVCAPHSVCTAREGDQSTPGKVTIPVLMYHHIREIRPWMNGKERLYSVTPGAFEHQMAALKRAGYETISLEEFLYAITTSTSRLPKRPVLLTFDDGHRGHYEYAFPVLEREGLKATFFIIADSTKLGGYMKEEMIREVDQSGLVDIGSHGRSHAMLTRLSGLKLDEEIDGSKYDLEHLLGHPVLAFAYPYGARSKAIEQDVEEAGYALGFGIGPGAEQTSTTRYAIRRIQINQNTDVVASLSRYFPLARTP